jgi:23S rRNA (uracil-5-)-methyltransferase RumA
MPAGEGAQREAKRRFVVDALERIGKLRDVEVDACAPSARSLGYRNKIELSFAEREGRPIVGYHEAENPALVIDVEACALADPRLQAPLAIVRACLADGRLRPRQGRLVLRASGSGADVLVGFRDGGEPFDEAETVAGALAGGVPTLRGVVRLVAPPGRRGGARVEAIRGEPWIGEEILGRSYRVPAGTFLQVNAAAAEELARYVLQQAGAPSKVTELYGGIGAIGAALADRGAAATIVDADKDAIACGEEAAARAGAGPVFVRSDVLRYLQSGPEVPDLVVADPPRTGFGPGVAEALAALWPPRIALVSCDPATLARDAAGLTARGYRLERVRPFDLFPQTAHVEAVGWLTRGEAPRRPPREASRRRASGSR